MSCFQDGITPVQESGRCNPQDCNNSTSCFVTCDGDAMNGNPGCRVGPIGCLSSAIPPSVPIKQLLRGSMAAPWVRLRFEAENCPAPVCPPNCPRTPTTCNPLDSASVAASWDYTEITTGNISQPGHRDICRAVIKSFQFGWGGVGSGNICKFVIHDESGNSLDAWFDRLFRNPQGGSQPTGQGVYKMKVTFGWIVVGGQGDDCPATVGWSASCNSIPPDFSNNPNKLICSPPLWFLPTNITSTMQNGKFIYELEGTDLLMQTWQNPLQRTFGSTNRKTHFVDAVYKLGTISQPPFNVRFVQLPEDGNSNTLENLEFREQPDNARLAPPALHEHYATSTADDSNGLRIYSNCTAGPNDEGACPVSGLSAADTNTELKERGPLGIWPCNGRDPIGIINDWFTNVMARTTQTNRAGRGMTVNYDSTYELPVEEQVAGLPAKGRLLVWRDGFPTGENRSHTYSGRLQALYTVNGGNCSPVYSFTPNIKFFFNSMRSGGLGSPEIGTVYNASENLTGTAATANIRPQVATWPNYREGGPSNSGRDRGNAARETMWATAEHLRTNVLANTIEAELKVQGDPSLWLCSPIYGYGRTVAIVVINPFFINDITDNVNACPQFSLTSSVCNDLLSRGDWFVKSVDHSIREGSYVTTLKVILFAPGVEIDARDNFTDRPMQLGGEPGSSDIGSCYQGTGTCWDQIAQGGVDVVAGAGTECDNPCDGGDILVVS